MLTAFGKLVRKLRIDKGATLKQMADYLEVSSAFLSAVENGKKTPPQRLVEQSCRYFSLNTEECAELEKAADLSIKEVNISLNGQENGDRRLALAFARKFKSLDQEQRDKILKILHGGEQ